MALLDEFFTLFITYLWGGNCKALILKKSFSEGLQDAPRSVNSATKPHKFKFSFLTKKKQPLIALKTILCKTE